MAAMVLPMPTPLFPAPGRAAASRSWIDDKKSSSAPAPAHVKTIPGRASGSKSWVEDKIAGGGDGRIGRAWSAAKRPASRAPSADRTDKKLKDAREAAPSIKIATETATAIVVETEAAPAPETIFAGPTFILSPDPSELPMPSFLILPRHACVAAI